MVDHGSFISGGSQVSAYSQQLVPWPAHVAASHYSPAPSFGPPSYPGSPGGYHMAPFAGGSAAPSLHGGVPVSIAHTSIQDSLGDASTLGVGSIGSGTRSLANSGAMIPRATFSWASDSQYGASGGSTVGGSAFSRRSVGSTCSKGGGAAPQHAERDRGAAVFEGRTQQVCETI